MFQLTFTTCFILRSLRYLSLLRQISAQNSYFYTLKEEHFVRKILLQFSKFEKSQGFTSEIKFSRIFLILKHSRNEVLAKFNFFMCSFNIFEQGYHV